MYKKEEEGFLLNLVTGMASVFLFVFVFFLLCIPMLLDNYCEDTTLLQASCIHTDSFQATTYTKKIYEKSKKMAQYFVAVQSIAAKDILYIYI